MNRLGKKEQKRTDTRLPRPGTVVYDLIFGDVEQETKAIKRFQFLNRWWIIPLYRTGLLPLLGFNRIFLLLETSGRKSGKKQITPLEYHRINNIIHIISARGEKADWYKNLQRNLDEVTIQLGFHRFKPYIEIIEDKGEKLDILRWYVTAHPTLAKLLMGWDRKTDDPRSTVLQPLVDFLQIIKVYECPPNS